MKSPALPLIAFTVLLFASAIAFNDDLCTQYGDMMPVPGIDGSDFCSTAGLTAPNSEKCLLLDFAGKSFTQGLGNTIGRLACRAAEQVPIPSHTATGQAINFTIPDRRPLPSSIDTSILSTEGATYHFWWSQLYNFGIAASCAASTAAHTVSQGVLKVEGAGRQWAYAPGWTVHSQISSNANVDTSQEGLYLPLAAVMQKGNTVAVLIRGTETFTDWEADFTYSQVAFKGPIRWPGHIHQGFARLAAYLWVTGIREAMDNLVLQQGSDVDNVVITGHSMGAGVGTLLSYTMQAYLNKNYSSVRVDAMLFAPPNVGDKTFAEAYGAVVNGRRIPFQSDVVAQLPCAPTVTACARGPWQGAPMLSVGVWAYHTVPGTVALTAEGMPMEQEAWASFKSMYACQLGRYVVATHVCAYQCYLSQFVQDGVSSNQCRLRAPEAGAAATGGQVHGTYCFSFPVASGEQYPYKGTPTVEAIVGKVAQKVVSMFV